MAEHPCYDTFWGHWAPALVDILNQIARGDAVDMSFDTYSVLCDVQHHIEDAVQLERGPIPDWRGRGTGFTEANEELLRSVAQQFLASLNADRMDVAIGHHTAPAPAWLAQTGQPQKQMVDAVRVLRGGAGGPVPPNCPPDGVIGRVKNALGS